MRGVKKKNTKQNEKRENEIYEREKERNVPKAREGKKSLNVR